MSDLVKRLRAECAQWGALRNYESSFLTRAAADRIEALEAALRALIAAVEFEAHPIYDGVDVQKRALILMRCAGKAEAALTPSEPRSDQPPAAS